MSPKTTSLAAGMTALGLLWSATRGVASRPEDAPPALSQPPSQTVLLLSNGQILRGEVSEDDSGYVLTQRAGAIRKSRREVEKVFSSMQELYQYKLANVPERDPDEHLKLAKWCIVNEMKPEAKASLESVLALSPDHAQAKNMLYNLTTTMERAAQRDADVVQTSAVEVSPPGKPQELNPDLLLPNRKVNGRPVIFDLPPNVAAKRYQDFVLFVHPEIQRHCVKCHDPRSNSKFQLMPVRSRRDLSNRALLMNNLDATLRLVDPGKPPARNELLLDAITPHGNTKQPVLSGPNHPAYRAFSTWVASLQATPQLHDGQNVKAAGYSPAPSTANSKAEAPDEQEGPGFATDRVTPPRQTPSTVSPKVPAIPPSTGSTFVDKSHPNVAPDADFRTISPLTGGADSATVNVGGKAVGGPNPTTPVGGFDPKTGVRLNPDGTPAKKKPLYPPEFDKPNRNRKPKTINTEALQKVLGNRNPGSN